MQRGAWSCLPGRGHGLAVMAAVLLALLAPGAAQAAKTYVVRVESEPTGATVYVDDKENGPAGTTPADISMTAGEHTLIVELEGHETSFATVVVKKSGKRQSVQVDLEPVAMAIIAVTAPSGDPASGAKILLDGAEVGVVPAEIQAEPGPHQVQVTRAGSPPFEAWIEVIAGETSNVEATLAAGAPRPAPRPASDTPAAAVSDKPAPFRPTLAGAGVGVEFLWRRFSYQDPMTENLRPFEADGVPAVVVDAELYPWHALEEPKVLRSLYATLRLALGLPLTSTTATGGRVDTTWREMDLGLRWRQALGPGAAVDLEAGYAQMLFTFGEGELAAEVPDVDYRSLRLAARGRIDVERITAWAGAEANVVLDGGVLATRFQESTVLGLGGSLGLTARIWRGLELRGAAHLTRFGWDFTSAAGDTYVASGGTDTFYGLDVGALMSF
jgi:PEGA domain-containing protein